MAWKAAPQATNCCLEGAARIPSAVSTETSPREREALVSSMSVAVERKATAKVAVIFGCGQGKKWRSLSDFNSATLLSMGFVGRAKGRAGSAKPKAGIYISEH